MIDAEVAIIDHVIRRVREHPGLPEITFLSEYVRMPASFPAVAIIEMDNVPYAGTADSGSGENHAEVTLEISIFSNALNRKKEECREIASVIDDIMLGLNARRRSLKPVTNLQDSTVSRMVGRYTLIVDCEGNLYRR